MKEWLEDQKELLYGKLDRKPVFKNETTEREGEIFLAVIKSGNAGISVGDLEKRVGLDRKTVRAYLKKLVERKFVRRGEGGHGRFFATAGGLSDNSSKATLLGLLFARGALQERSLLVQSNMRDSGIIDFLSIPQFTPANEDRYGLLRCLFEFSSTIGAFVIYVLIQSMNPSSVKTETNKRHQYHASQVYIEKAISELIPYLMPAFGEYIEQYLSLEFNLKSDDEFMDFFLNWHILSSKYNSKVIRQLLDSFGRLYPHVLRNLNKIKEDIPKEIDSIGQHREYIRMKLKSQSNCVHEFVEGKKPDTNWVYLKHCRKCHYTNFRKRVYRK